MQTSSRSRQRQRSHQMRGTVSREAVIGFPHDGKNPS